MSYMSVRYKVVVASCAALLCGVALAHFPIDVSPESDDGLLRVGWTPIQVGICSHRPFQLFSGDADVYGIAAGLLNMNQKSAIASLAPLNAVANNYFTQVGLIDVCGFNYAFEVGLLNLTGRNIGVSVGAFNVESNLGDRGGDPYPWLPGLQVGLANAGGGLQAVLRVTMVSVVPFRSACSTTIRTASPSGCRSSTSHADERTGDMPPPWLEIVYVVVSMAIVIGLFSLGVWMVKRSFRIKRKWVCWLVRILGILISGYILVCFIVYFVCCRTVL